jgi:uncharacterized protein
MTLPIKVLHPSWRIVYNGSDISGDIAKMVHEIEWREAIGGMASEVSVTVEDTGGRWRGSSYPKPTDSIDLQIGYAGSKLLDCGTFTIDEFEYRFPPSTVTMRAVESWITAPLNSLNSYGYQDMTVLGIAGAVAQRHGWTLVASPGTEDSNLGWNYKAQGHETDLEFLQRLATEHGYYFQVRPPQLIFYSKPVLEQQTPTGPTISQTMVTSGRFHFQALAEPTYASAGNLYTDPIEGQLQSSGRVQVSGSPPVTANSLNLVQRVENAQQARVLAEAALHDANMLLYDGELALPGTTAFRAGQTIQLGTDFGIYGGTWLIEQAAHTLGARQGYVTRLTIRTPPPASTTEPGGADDED